MIPRYSRPQMTALWEPEARFKIWFEIEAHATEKLGELGVVPPSAAKALWDWWATNPAIDVDAIDAIEAVTKHDVIAFLTWVAEQVVDAAAGPTVRLGGLDWISYDRRDVDDPGNVEFALVTEIDGSTVVISGTADDTEFAILAEAIGKEVLP